MPVLEASEQLPIHAARAGDEGAWDTLFRRYQLPLYAYVVEMVRDEQDALDLVQETFVQAVRYIGSLRDDARFGSWLFGIAHQRCLLLWRRRHRHAEWADAPSLDEIEEPFMDEPGPLEWLLHREQADRLTAAIAQLPPTQRGTLLLHELEDFSVEEVARITGAEVGTVKSRLHYARKALRRILEEEKT